MVAANLTNGGHGQAVVKRWSFGGGGEGDPYLAPQAEPFLFKIHQQNIQEGNNTQEDQQD